MISSLEKKITESDSKERQVMESFYKGLMEEMRTSHERDMEKLQKANENLTSKIAELTSIIAASQAAANSSRSRAARTDKYGPEKRTDEPSEQTS